MKELDNEKKKIERITEIYVAVFPVEFGKDQLVEVILAGNKKVPGNPNMMQIRVTAETFLEAVPDLVALCDKIVEDQEGIQSYRLLKFDHKGIHTLSPDDYRQFHHDCAGDGWGYA